MMLDQYRFSNSDGFPEDNLSAYIGDLEVGYLQWNALTGEVLNVWVRDTYRRRGIASLLWKEAQGRTEGFLRHSDMRTPAGDAWARSVGGELPAIGSSVEVRRTALLSGV